MSLMPCFGPNQAHDEGVILGRLLADYDLGEHLTGREVEKLIESAKGNQHGARDIPVGSGATSVASVYA